MINTERASLVRHLYDDMIGLQLPECFEESHSIQYLFFCEELLMCDTNLHYKDCSKMHSGSCSQMKSSCKCPIVFSIDALHSIMLSKQSSNIQC